jgi:hypothetical protein
MMADRKQGSGNQSEQRQNPGQQGQQGNRQMESERERNQEQGQGGSRQQPGGTQGGGQRQDDRDDLE